MDPRAPLLIHAGAAPNKLFQLLAGGLAKELRDRRVVLICDPAEELRPFLDEVATKVPEPGGFGSIGAPPSLPLSPWLEDVRGLRRDHPGPYATIAAAIETELQVQERIAKERPWVLGAIDTFPCEESLLHYNYMMEKR